MTLEFVVSPSTYSIDTPGNFVLNWRAGTELSTALQNCLSVAYPTLPIVMNIGSGLVLDHDEIHVASTLEGLAIWLLQFTDKHLLNPVNLYVQAGQVIAIDPSYRPTPKQIAFTDFVGQPTWIAPRTMQAKMIMRGDVQMGDRLLLPQGMQDSPGAIAMTQNAWLPSSRAKTKLTFNGPFQVLAIRHVGNSRSTDGGSWSTIVNALQEV